MPTELSRYIATFCKIPGVKDVSLVLGNQTYQAAIYQDSNYEEERRDRLYVIGDLPKDHNVLYRIDDEYYAIIGWNLSDKKEFTQYRPFGNYFVLEKADKYEGAKIKKAKLSFSEN